MFDWLEIFFNDLEIFLYDFEVCVYIYFLKIVIGESIEFKWVKSFILEFYLKFCLVGYIIVLIV